MRWIFFLFLPFMFYGQWSVNDIFKISVKNTNSFSTISDWENLSFSSTAITPTQERGWLCFFDVFCGEEFLFSHVFLDFEGGNGVRVEIYNSEDNSLLLFTNFIESGFLSLSTIYRKNIDIWVYLSSQTKLYSFGIARKKEVPLTPTHVIVQPKILYYPEGVLSIDLMLLSPAYLEIELYNKRGDRLASIIPMAYYGAGPLSIQWTPLSIAKTYLKSGSAYVYIRYRVNTSSQEWAHRFEIVYL